MSKHKSKNIKRKSGRVLSKYYDPDNGAYYMIYWNDWNDWRDSMRSFEWDKTKSRKVKQRQLNLRRLRQRTPI
jgi:hypothetical protein